MKMFYNLGARKADRKSQKLCPTEINDRKSFRCTHTPKMNPLPLISEFLLKSAVKRVYLAIT